MSELNYPPASAYKLPKRNVLAISCMDLRLTDNLVDFLHFDNLQNRYDHFILAGASLLCSEKHSHLFVPGQYEKYTHWKKSLNDHIELAINLHKIKDIYIFEHQDCGAYSNLLDPQKVDLSSLDKELTCHKKFVATLADEIHAEVRTEKNEQGEEQDYRLNVHCFFLDLRGNVELLYTLAT